MAQIIVSEKNKKADAVIFIVQVKEQDDVLEYEVVLDDSYFKKIGAKNVSKEELIKQSFVFLLEREPKESILRSFNLKVISTYFPEYETQIKKMIK